jgi:hypothetical protein
MFSLSLIALFAGLLTSSVNCIGTASVKNFCDFEVYLWSVANLADNFMNRLPRATGEFNETYRANPNGGGISLKIATAPYLIDITQFEYTYRSDIPDVYYDISNVNGYPFKKWGLALSPSFPNCPFISCDPGVAHCSNVYNKPHDDFATKSCNVSASLTLTLCPVRKEAASSITTPTTRIEMATKMQSKVYGTLRPSSFCITQTSTAASASPLNSSVYIAPVTTSSTAVASTTVASYGIEKYTGDVTYYNPAGGNGACGFGIADSDHVVAIAHDTWDLKGTLSNSNPWCGTKIMILNKMTGKIWPAIIGDKCMGNEATPCIGGNIDLPQGFFNEAFPSVNGRGHSEVFEWWVEA